ncbi:hypothetical protein [Kangiella sediminilitoris]|uniref:Uncharacterized protein n=1 Tax=Kangiella sediminilitoris TaxID=1144748 RepID=A0A1B3B934_9GAMM|nr:hypothetical protein [Kangiella sediminilitoris]AOE49312.1 hypothetical protein KS2013_588 [Kangiella sediminilitoris]
MCVLVVPEEMKQSKEYTEVFEAYWKEQQKDRTELVAAERVQDKSFLSMVKKSTKQ